MIELIIIIVLLILVIRQIKRPSHFPPGPTWLPIVGNNLQIKRLAKKVGGFHLALLELSKQCNTNVLGIKLGKELVVVVFTSRIIKSVLASNDFNARPRNFFIELRCLGSIKGVTCTDGDLWNVQKSFLLKNLHNLGFGRRTIEHNIQNEVRDIINNIEENTNIEVGKLLAPAVISVLWSVIAGNRLCKKDERLNQLLDRFKRRSKLFDLSGGWLGQNPWLRFVAPEWTGYNLIRKINGELKELFMQPIEQHHKTWSNEMDSDLIYLFITEMKKEYPHYSFTDEQLLMLCLDLFIAGSGTTSGTLDFAFFMMIKHPHVQLNIQKLLDQELQNDDPVNYADRQKFPYIEAVLLEVERFCTIAPIIGPRKARKNTVIEGYSIPKNTTILLHTYSVCMSDQLWEHPERFNPERFLTTSGDVIHSDDLMTFGFGKRRCIGESLAKSFIFIFFTEILRYYSIGKGADHDKTSGNGMFLSAEYTAKFKKRQQR